MKRETLFKIYKNIFPLWLVDILFRPKKESAEGEFLIYETKYGHCPFCGNLDCDGKCFK